MILQPSHTSYKGLGEPGAAAPPLMIRALARDRDEATTKMLVQPMFCSNSRHDKSPTPGNKTTVMRLELELQAVDHGRSR